MLRLETAEALHPVRQIKHDEVLFPADEARRGKIASGTAAPWAVWWRDLNRLDGPQDEAALWPETRVCPGQEARADCRFQGEEAAHLTGRPLLRRNELEGILAEQSAGAAVIEASCDDLHCCSHDDHRGPVL